MSGWFRRDSPAEVAEKVTAGSRDVERFHWMREMYRKEAERKEQHQESLTAMTLPELLNERDRCIRKEAMREPVMSDYKALMHPSFELRAVRAELQVREERRADEERS